ncbi:MAG: Hsp20 family protein [Pseudomonadota bacterium]
MTRMSPLSHPMFLGFEEMERLLNRIGKSGGDGYPPYNIERLHAETEGQDRLRITLAVAGFSEDQLEVTIEDRQLVIRGRQMDDKDRDFLHRGIAARQFQRSFVLADGIEIVAANLANGLLAIDLMRQPPEKTVTRIEIGRNTDA